LGPRLQWCTSSDLYATWIFYTILNSICAEVVVAFKEPLEKISKEMVLRGCYHYARVYLAGTTSTLVEYLTDDPKLFGLVKRQRK